VGQIRVQEAICNLASAAGATDANILFGDQLRLVEYKTVQEVDRLKLRLYWRAERFIDKEYSVFVHVFEPETGVPVAQDDGRPRDGAYPMGYWWPGDVVDDRVEIPLVGVPSGEYGIAIGVYDPISGERLPLVDQDGQLLVEDGRFVLPQEIVMP
jgi:hypothetical protein